MRVVGALDPGLFTVEQIPGTNRSLIRLFQNVQSYHKDDFDGFQYDEYHVEVETWDGVYQNVLDNFEVFLSQGIKNEIRNPYQHEQINAIIDGIDSV